MLKKIDFLIFQITSLSNNSRDKYFSRTNSKKKNNLVEGLIDNLFLFKDKQDLIIHLKSLFIANISIYVKTKIINKALENFDINEKNKFAEEVAPILLLTNNFDLYEKYFKNLKINPFSLGEVFLYKIANPCPSHLLNKLINCIDSNFDIDQNSLKKFCDDFLTSQVNKSNIGKSFVLLYLLSKQNDKNMVPYFERLLDRVGSFLKAHRSWLNIDKEVGQKAILEIINKQVVFKDHQQFTAFLSFSSEMNFLSKSKKMKDYNDLLFSYVYNYQDKKQIKHAIDELAKYKKYKSIISALESGLIDDALKVSPSINKNNKSIKKI